MKKVRKEPRLLANVMEAIASFKERQGSTSKQIIEFIINYVKRRKDGPRNVTLQVKRALEHGVHSGLIRQRGGKYSLGFDRKDYAIYKRFKHFTDANGDCNSCKRRRKGRRRGRRSRRSRRRGRRGRRRASIEEDDAADETDTSVSLAEGTPEPMDKSRRRRRRRARQGRRKKYHRTRRAGTPIEDSSGSSDVINKDSKAGTPPENRRSDQSKSDYQSKAGSTHQGQNQEQDGPVDCGNPDCLCNIKQEEDSPQSQIEEFLDVLTVITPPVAYLFKQIVFFGHSSAFLTLMDFLKDDDLVSIPLQLRKQISDSLQVAKIIGVGYQACCTMTILFIVIWPMFTEHQLPVQFTLFDLGDFYAFMYLLQIFALANAAANSSSLDLIALTLMCIVKGQICVLNDKIRSLEEINASKGHGAQRVKYVSGCVLHHTKIIELVALIENVYSQIVLIEYLTSMVVICNIGFQLVIVELASFAFLLMLTFLVTMLCQLGMYCWFGNEIMLHSAAIRDACYESDWIHSCPQVRKMLLMIMERRRVVRSLYTMYPNTQYNAYFVSVKS
ncbi:hypothetical protein HUJ04_004675 [Dendroctonus ponderosae]|nr:hypothetical protein HUJ04_004675 [Dendroctonus ponderosae]